MNPIFFTRVSNRRKYQVIRIVIATSLIWLLIDVFLLMYFTDCTARVEVADCANGKPAETEKPRGFLYRFLPDSKVTACCFKKFYEISVNAYIVHTCGTVVLVQVGA